MRELLRAKSTIDYTSRGAVDRPNRATFKPLKHVCIDFQNYYMFRPVCAVLREFIHQI
jgi:hypothetical protein